MTPDPATLREALEYLEVFALRTRRHPLSTAGKAQFTVADAALWALDLIEGGALIVTKEDGEWQALVEALDGRLADWEFHDVRLRVNSETAWLKLTRRDFVTAMVEALDALERAEP